MSATYPLNDSYKTNEENLLFKKGGETRKQPIRDPWLKMKMILQN